MVPHSVRFDETTSLWHAGSTHAAPATGLPVAGRSSGGPLHAELLPGRDLPLGAVFDFELVAGDLNGDYTLT